MRIRNLKSLANCHGAVRLDFHATVNGQQLRSQKEYDANHTVILLTYSPSSGLTCISSECIMCFKSEH